MWFCNKIIKIFPFCGRCLLLFIYFKLMSSILSETAKQIVSLCVWVFSFTMNMRDWMFIKKERKKFLFSFFRWFFFALNLCLRVSMVSPTTKNSCSSTLALERFKKNNARRWCDDDDDGYKILLVFFFIFIEINFQTILRRQRNYVEIQTIRFFQWVSRRQCVLRDERVY